MASTWFGSHGAVGDLGRAEYYGPDASDHVAAALFEWRPASKPTYAYTVRLLPASGVFGILGCMGPNSQQFADLYDKLKSLAERQLAQPLVRLSEALDQLATRDQRLAEVVDLKYFCGYTFEDIAAMRGASKRTVLRDWEKARLLLYRQLKDLPDSAADPIE